MKKVGPDLKEVRMKLRPEWIPVWLTESPRLPAHHTMPRFRAGRGRELKPVAAFIWQAGIDGKLPPSRPAIR